MSRVELARSNAYYGAWALNSDAAELPIAAAVARIAACDAGWLATKENIQTHGGMGFTWEFDCHLFYRRAKLLALGARRRPRVEAPADRRAAHAQHAQRWPPEREDRMDFEDTPEEAAFRAEARAFLEANAERRKPGEVEGYRRGQDAPGAMRARPRSSRRSKHAAGFAGITWPTEWGGRGGTPIQQVIYNQEEAKYDVLSGVFGIGLGMAIPTICTWGTPEQRARFAPPALRGEEVWCQLFSEPAGGSDLAALRTRAERDGDDWIVNGQKIWTSGAHYSDYGILVARTDPNVPKHEGLTFFILDMKTPGIEIRPIRQMSGSSHFNEVFFTDVRIPDSQPRRRRGRGLAGRADHADERALRHARGARPGLRRGVRAGARDRAGGRPGDRERGGAGETGGVVCPHAGAAVHQVPHA